MIKFHQKCFLRKEIVIQLFDTKHLSECVYPHFVWLSQVSEQGLIEILEKVSQQTEKKTTVKVSFLS